MNAVLQTTVGRSVSQLQLEFIKTTGDITSVNAAARSSGNLLGIQFTSGRIAYELYAVSREDARKMAEAFVEVWLRENNAALKPLLDEYLGKFQNRRKELQREIANAQQKIPEKEQQLKDLRAQLAELKKKHYYQSPEQAQKAIEELNTMLNTERIELVGLLARRKAIEMHRRDVEQKIRSRASSLITSWEPLYLNLEQKYIDLLIDLDVARAREDMALKLRGQAQGFLDLNEDVRQADAELARLQYDLSQANTHLRAVDQMLAEPRAPMLPLQIHDNRVSIRPVTVKFAE